MNSDSLVQIGLQLHRVHDHGLFPAYFEYLPPEHIQGKTTIVTYQFGNPRGTNCTYNAGYHLSINVQPGDQCSITLRVYHPDSLADTVSHHLARFTYSEQGLVDIETNGIDLKIYPEPPLVDTMVEAFEKYAELYRKAHPEIAVDWYHGADEQVCRLYRLDPLAVRFGWLLGSTCNARFFGEQAFELELIEHCLHASPTQKKSGKADLMFPYWYDPLRGLILVSPEDFIAEWKALHALLQERQSS